MTFPLCISPSCVLMSISAELAHVKGVETALIVSVIIVIIANTYCHSQCARVLTYAINLTTAL